MSLTSEDQAQLDYLIQWVNARMDELLPDGQTGDSPIPNIERELDEAARYLLRTFPKQVVYPAVTAANLEQLTQTRYPDNKHAKKTVAECPDDYLRFIRVEVEGWQRPLDHLISVDSPRYRQFNNRFFDDNPYKPVAALIPSGGSGAGSALELRPAGTVSAFLYIPSLKAYKLPESLLDPLIWLVASRGFTILRMGNLSQVAMSNMQMSLSRLLIGMEGEEMRQQPVEENS